MLWAVEELPPALSVVVSVEELFHKASRSALAAVSSAAVAAVGCGSTGGLKLSAQAMRRASSFCVLEGMIHSRECAPRAALGGARASSSSSSALRARCDSSPSTSRPCTSSPSTASSATPPSSPSSGARCGARHVDNGHTSPLSSRTPGATCSPGGAVVSAATSKTGAVSVSSTGATTGGGAHSKLVGGGAHPLPTQPGSRLHTSISIHLPHVAISRELDEDALCRGIILC